MYRSGMLYGNLNLIPKETSLGVALASFNPQKIALKTE